MHKQQAKLLLLPLVLFALASIAASRGEVASAGWLAILGAGSILGVAYAELSLRGKVAGLDATTVAMAQDVHVVLPDPKYSGPLAPVSSRLRDISDALELIREETTTDRLTRVANRPMLLAQLFAEVERANRHRRPLAVAFIDLDHFKKVNDSYGHAVGDVVLHGVAGVFREHTRRSDFVGRYGGEEFVLVLPETTVQDAAAVAEKVRLRVLRLRFQVPNAESLSVSVSIGIAGGSGQDLHVDQLLRDADAAMYAAKSLGRNQTYVFAEPDDDKARIPRAPISTEGKRLAAAVGDQARQAAEDALASMLWALPDYRGRPSERIAAISSRMAAALGLPDVEVERIRLAALLHDIGQLAVPAHILEKPGPLTPDEWLSMTQHPRAGDAIIERAAALGDARAIILHHHERYGGHGYPYGMRGSEIPLGSRILAVADAYDAMVRDRPYRTAMTHAEAVAELKRCANIQFDPELVQLFCDFYASRPPVVKSEMIGEGDRSAKARTARRSKPDGISA